jgi:hypothetical protein
MILKLLPGFSSIALLLFACAITASPASAGGASITAAANCTLYASPAGSAENTGTTPTAPLTLREASNRTQPGDVVCLMSGTYNLANAFYINRSGSPSGWIVYTSYDNGAKLVWTGTGQDDMLQITAGAKYIEINGLAFDGNNQAYTGIKANTTSHVRMLGNNIKNAGASGIATYQSDYITVEHNNIYHTGYGYGWGSGVSLNTNVWSDQAQGFHNIITHNIISGTDDNSAHHSDGNGIIIDLGGDTPPVLIANNLVYQNGGRCIHTLNTMNNWIINNTCYANGLDSQVGAGSDGLGELAIHGSSKTYLINNLVFAWTHGYAYYQYNSDQVYYYHNSYYYGLGLKVPASVAGDPNQIRMANPIFVWRPALDLNADGQYRNAIPPDQISNRLKLQQQSSLIDIGIDPRTIPNIPPEIQADLALYILNGKEQPQGSGFDLGAYEYHQSVQSQNQRIFLASVRK